VQDIIKDATVGYDFGQFNIQVGERKTPVGMDFNTSGKKLDIVKRAMEKSYVLERTAGAYLFGNAGSIGYAAWYGNAATRGAADNNAVVGEDSSYGGRVSYDMGKMLHAELSYGVSTYNYDNIGGNAANAAADDLSVMDIGLKSQPMPNLTLKAEYLSATNVGNVEDRDQTVWYLHGGYEFTPMVEGVLRHYSSTAEDGNNLDHTATETWVGANIFLNPEKHHEARIQLFYAMPGGDDQDSDYSNVAGVNATGAGGGNTSAHRFKGAQAHDQDGEMEGAFWAMFQTSF
jgi:hypothetical protein